MYLLRLSCRSWRLAPFSQLFSAFAVGFLLFLISFLFWIQQGLRPLLNRLQGEQVITAYLNSSVERKDEDWIVDQIQNQLGAHPSRSTIDIQLVNSHQFIDQLKKQYSGLYAKLGQELEDLGQEVDQVVPRYVSISGVLPASALNMIKQIKGIESVESAKDRFASVIGAFRALRWLAIILMFGLAVALLTGLIHLVRMNAYLHRDALSLLKFWGAGNGVLAVPGMVSGLGVGLLGGAIAFFAWTLFGTALTHHVRGLSILLKQMPGMYSDMPFLLFVGGGVMGFFAGIVGSLSASHLPTKLSSGDQNLL